MNVSDLIEAQDMNGLLRVVDSWCESRDWDRLLDLADRCEEAVERGKQLWPIAAHIEYRIALEAPGDYAGDALDSDLGRFVLGPLTEVAASNHTWDELVEHISMPHVAAYVAQERVLRGEDLSGDVRAHPDVLELPLWLLEWEPTYCLATYRSDVVEVAEPWDPRAPLQTALRTDAPELDEPELEAGLLDLVTPWTNESNGAARSVVVEGDGPAAASALALDELRIAPLDPDEALQRIAWAAASGGVHGRRRGAAFGRSAAWATVALLADSSWPAEPDALGRDLARLTWYRWDEGESEKGWVLRLAVEDAENGWAAAVAATDLAEEDTDG